MSRAPDEHVTEHVTAAPLLWPLKKDTSYFKMTPKGAGSSKMSEKECPEWIASCSRGETLRFALLLQWDHNLAPPVSSPGSMEIQSKHPNLLLVFGILVEYSDTFMIFGHTFA